MIKHSFRQRAWWLLVLMFILTAAGGSACKEKGAKPVSLESIEPKQNQGDRPTLAIVKGRGFTEEVAIKFGDVPTADTRIVDDKHVAILVPDLKSGTYDLVAETKDGKQAKLAQAFIYSSPLKITAIRPPQAQANQPFNVRIFGNGFQEGIQVWFGNTAASEAKLIDSQHMVVSFPATGSGRMKVRVQNKSGAQSEFAETFLIVSEEEQMPLEPFKIVPDGRGIEDKPIRDEHSIAFADFNGDDIVDALIGANGNTRLYQGTKDGRFVDVTEQSGIAGNDIMFSAWFGDYDNDGKPDILVTGGSNLIFHNLGEGKFENVTEKSGLFNLQQTLCASFADFDGDGFLDIFLGRAGLNDMLFRGHGDGTFEEVYPDLMTGHKGTQTWSAAWSDYNKDGWPDLYAGGHGDASMLLYNEAGKGFKEIAAQLGVDNRRTETDNPDWKYYANYGVSWVDYDNDGWMDLQAVNFMGPNYIYRNKEGKAFEKVHEQLGLREATQGISVVWGDFDNDGYQDFFLADIGTTSKIFHNRRAQAFDNVSQEVNMPFDTIGKAAAFIDVDNSGTLDLFILDDPIQDLWLMNPGYQGRHWLKVRLKGTKSNSMAIGARVELQTKYGTMTREMSAASGYRSQNLFELHFGLGNQDKVEKLTVYWPSGDQKRTTVMENVAADQILHITEEDK